MHPLVENRPLVLGGRTIPFPRGLAGHSDADCLTHAIADSILWACGLPDIGRLFPDTNPEYAGIDSQLILSQCLEKARDLGYSLVNVDATVIAEAPKLGPYIDVMKTALGRTLEVPPDRIGIKATTNEGIGALGRGDAIAAQAVCLLQQSI